MGEPSINVLTAGGQSETEEPAVAARGASQKQVEVVLFAFDGTFSTGASVSVKLPKDTVSRDGGVQAIIVFGIGIDDAAIGRGRAVVGKVWTGVQVRRFFGGGEGATPFDAQAVVAEASEFHGAVGDTDGDALLESQRAGVVQMALVTLVEWNDQRHVPALGSQAEIADDIVGRIQRGSLERPAQAFPPLIEGGQTEDTVVAIAIGHGDDQRQLAAMLERIGGQLVAGVTIDPTMAVAIPAPEGVRVAVGTMAATAFMGFLTPIITGTALLTLRIGPGG